MLINVVRFQVLSEANMSSGKLRRVVSKKLTDVLEVLTASIIIVVMMEAVSTSETSVSFYKTTRRNIPKDSHHRPDDGDSKHL
jgi:hypothetical protein